MHGTSSFHIYKASAGSGKTFELTLHYLQLALQDAAGYRGILAVTFTNKATAEMKERILQVLRDLATQSGKAVAYEEALLQRMPNFSASELVHKAKSVYQSILHDYTRFSITTIDTFVQRIIRSFAWEMGIDSGFKLQLKNDQVKTHLALRLYDRLSHDKDLLHWATALAKERLENGKNWEFREELLRFSNELFKEKFNEFEASIRNLSEEDVQHQFRQLQRHVQQYLQASDQKWKAEGTSILQLLLEHGLTIEDFSYGKGGFANYFNKVANEGLSKPGARVNEVLNDASKMVTKKAPETLKQTVSGLEHALIGSLKKLTQWYAEELQDYTTAYAISKNLAFLRLMRVFIQELADYRNENNLLLISDTHLLLKRLTEDASASFIYEKTGQRYQHFLIDEFQDTSAFQWGNFVPMLTESLSQGHYNMLVGDVKQAIYRWRNGDWRLLLHGVQRDLKAFQPEVKTLQQNFRSTREIIAFNNLLFHLAPHMLQQEMTRLMERATTAVAHQLEANGYAHVFHDAYADSFQQIPDNAKANGCVHMKWIPEADEQTFAEQVLPVLFQQIQSLLGEGFQPSDIAILTRTNKEATEVVEGLTALMETGPASFGIISGDALLLGSNRGIQTIIAALRWLQDDRQTIALAQLRWLMHLQKSGAKVVGLDIFASNADNSSLPPIIFDQRRELRALPMIELVHRLVVCFELHNCEQHAPFLLAFADKVQEWCRYGDDGLTTFLAFWDEEGHAMALPASNKTNAVEVLTVHKSKGLAFQIVMMPFVDWPLLHETQKAPMLWVQNHDTAFNELPVLPVKYQSDLAESSYAYAFYEELVLSVMDNLNVLYVAFTRARQRLYTWSPFYEANKKKEEAKKFAFSHIGHLIQAVAQSNTEIASVGYTDCRRHFNLEKRLWLYGKPQSVVHEKLEQTAQVFESMVYNEWQQQLALRYQPLGQNEDGPAALPRKQGVLLHDVLSKLQHPSQLTQVLAQVKREGWLDDFQLQKIGNTLEAVLLLPALAPWHNQQFKRLAERNILAAGRKLKRPDLILYNQNACLVYDFKFTGTTDQWPKHREQVWEYMNMLQQMGFAQLQGFVIYGLEKKAIPVNF